MRKARERNGSQIFERKKWAQMNFVLTVFIDALKPETVEYMEFLNSFENVSRIKTELPAYSNNCHASMYTGVFPNKHKHHFIWKFRPETSPFKLLSKLGVVNRSRRLKKFLYKSICLPKSMVVPYGDVVFENMPISFWANFDFDMVKFWGKPNSFIESYPTIFEILKRGKIPYRVIWIWTPFRPIKILERVNPPNNRDYRSWLYVFIGDIDYYAHKFGQDSPKIREVLQKIDYTLEGIYSRSEKIFSDNFYFFVFSDHGQAEIREKVEASSLFSSHGRDLCDYIHFIDANYLRFWFRNEREKEEVEKILSKLEGLGFTLDEEFLIKYHAEISDNRYGDLIFYLDEGAVFQEIIPKDVRYMHGYLPDYPDSDAVCVANRKIKGTRIKLQDITPSILQALGLEIPDYMDGEPIWK
ncbi:hypothetical protein DRP04_03745 [Archaeoglobales archaeon]|nr:MAG: hypothetical protein DRP04_03745 [Archaeoglobales archaeon]